jgi:hypothetical protein
MRRKWAYLGAVLPLSTAVSAWATSAAADPELPRPLRKNGMLDEDAGEKATGDHADSLEKASPGAKAQPRDASQDDAARVSHDDDLDGAPPSGDPGVQVSVPTMDGSMYAPAGGQAVGLGLAATGGGSTGAAIKMIEEEASDTTDPATIPSEDSTDPVLIDPADTDAMLILLGGMAEGSGDGAMSFGEVVFDVVDYGPYTVGYGYATYMASGSEEAVAHTFADVAGADLVFTYDFGDSNGDSAYSTTYLLAIDFEGDLSAQAEGGNVNWLELLGQGPFAQNVGNEEDAEISIDGNFSSLALASETGEGLGPATEVSALTFNNLGSVLNAFMVGNQSVLSIQAEAQGIDTMTAGTASVFEVEDQFSSVSGAVTIVA